METPIDTTAAYYGKKIIGRNALLSRCKLILRWGLSSYLRGADCAKQVEAKKRLIEELDQKSIQVIEKPRPSKVLIE